MTDKLKVLEFFSGIGAFRQGLINQNIEHEVSGVSEYDKYAIKSYNAMFGETENFGDITKIRSVPKSDMWTYGFPCQDISVAGNQEGIKEGTRSGLLLEFERILEAAVVFKEQPKMLLMENVKNLISKKHKPDFDRWLKRLDALGYNSYWEILNTKDYGLPQNRERVFCLSIKKELDNGFEFPEKQELKLRLKDMLEDEVDEKFYIDNEKTKKLLEQLRPNLYDYIDIRTPKINQLGMLDIKGSEQIRRVYGIDGISPTLNTMQGGNRQPKILFNLVDNKIIKVGKINSSQDGIVHSTKGISQCISAGHGNTPKIIIDDTTGFKKESRVYEDYSPTLKAGRSGLKTIDNEYRIRKLTPNECWKLQGFSDEQFHKAEEVCSNTRLYQQAGNSISVPVLEEIYKQMVKFEYLKRKA